MPTHLNGGRSWTLQSVNNAINGRYHMGAFLPHAAGSAPMSAWRDGVVTSSNTGGSGGVPRDLQVVPTTPSASMSLTIQPGHAVNSRSANGMYLSYLETAGNVTLDTAPTVNPRRDLIYARIYDAAIGDVMPSSPALTSPGGFRVEVRTGTPSVTPVLPSLNPGEIGLADVTVGVNVTSITSGNIVDIRRSAFTPGGARVLLPGDSLSDAGAVTGEMRFTNNGIWTWGTNAAWSPASIPVFATTGIRDAMITSPTDGMMAYVSGVQSLYTYRSGSWQRAIGGTFNNNADQTLNTGANKILYQTSVLNPGTMITVTGNNTFQVPFDGVYTMHVSNVYKGTLPSSVSSGIALSSDTGINTGRFSGFTFIGGSDTNTSAVEFLSAGTQVSTFCYLNDGASRTLDGTSRLSRFTIWKTG